MVIALLSLILDTEKRKNNEIISVFLVVWQKACGKLNREEIIRAEEPKDKQDRWWIYGVNI
jgi:hypothetical protein